MIAIRRMVVFAACLLAAGSARAQSGGSQPPDAVPAHARADSAALTFPVSGLTFKIEPYRPSPEEIARLSPPDANAPLVRPAAAAETGGSLPPSSVPANARAEVRPLAFKVAAIGFKTEPTIADVSVRAEGRARRFTLAADVLFAFDRAELRPEAGTALNKFRAQLGPQADRARLRIEGHTDGKGSDPYNDRLALQRAHSVEAWLSTSGGLAPSALSIAGFGKHRPVAPNTKPDGSDDPDGRQRNRRVEIVVEM